MDRSAKAKTPAVAIGRVLRSYGLMQGTDFRVKGQYENGVRTCTYVAVYTASADTIIADNANLIEELTNDWGWPFYVSIHWTKGGHMWTGISNQGPRVRDVAPVTAGEVKAKVAETVIETAPVEMLADTPLLDLLPSPVPADIEAMVKIMVQNAAERARQDRDAILAAISMYYPKGTRVRGEDEFGAPLTGQVNGYDYGWVTDTSHFNYGRAYVGVTWDTGSGPIRNRPFVDHLTII